MGDTKSGNNKDYQVKGKINIYTFIEKGERDMKQRYRGRFSALISRNYKGIIEKQIRKKQTLKYIKILYRNRAK